MDVTAPVRLDVSGLLLTADGKVRSDDDFVFYNQPAGPGVTHRAGSGGTGDTITVDTAAVPADIEKIVVTASLDTPGPRSRAPSRPPPCAAPTTAPSSRPSPARLGAETALVTVEIYRRAGAWKVRAVGQGTPTGWPVSPPTSASPSRSPPPAGRAARARGAAAARPQGLAAQMPPPRPPPPRRPRRRSGPAGKINLDKGRVNLQKNQTVSLVKGGQPLLSSVKMGLGWEPAFRSKDIDLDASVIAFGVDRKKIDACFFGKLTILNGAIQHSGDNLTGEGSGDDETITVHLSGLPPEVTGLVFTVNSFSGQKFTDVAKAYCRLLDAQTNEELARFDLTHSESRTGVLMAKMIKQFSGEWEMTAMGDYVDSRTVRGMVKPAGKAL
ncbi:TerD family protein [Streptomyces sp. M19]